MKPFSALLSSFRNYSSKPVISNAGKPRTFSRAKIIKWNDQQLQLIEAGKSRHSIFITGSVGTGKTKLIEQIFAFLRICCMPRNWESPSLFWSIKPFSALLSTFTKPQITIAEKPVISRRVKKIKWTDQQLQVIEAVERSHSIFFSGSAGTGISKLIEPLVAFLRICRMPGNWENPSLSWNIGPFSALLSTFRKYCIKPHFSNAGKPTTCGRVKKIKWTDQQLQVIEAVKSCQSVFITGSAGTGKTELIAEIVRVLRKIHGKQGVFVTASTGIAACALSGQTLHSFAGVGLAEADSGTLLSRVLSDKRALKRWMNAKALVIDEISMIDGELFDKLEYIARGVMRRKFDASKPEVPWAGIQLVVSGDFFQLPPVDRLNRKKFAFEADCWDHSFQFQASLHSVFRQSDLDYVRILEGIRKGNLEPQDEKLLEQRLFANENELDDTVVRLFPRNEDVDRINEKRLHDLGEEIVVYEAFDTGTEPWNSQLNQGIAPTRLKLCKGARVMLTKNVDVKGKLVNGATGTITGFVNVSKGKGKVKKICRSGGDIILPLVKFDSGPEVAINPCKWEVSEGDEVKAKRLQLPLVLAWATSIHKSQGMTLDKLYTDLSKAFGYGMSYVAFSRVRDLDGLYLSGFNPSSVKAHPKVQAFYKKTFE